jgi:hypothetical protein
MANVRQAEFISSGTHQSIPLPRDGYYRGRTETLNTKIGPSIGAVTLCCSLRDELPNFGR